MKYRNYLSRRTFLKGAGTVAVGLPFVDAMMATSAFANTAAPPKRLITTFFGLGLPKEYTTNGFSGVLEPLAPFADKFSFFRNVSVHESDCPANNHFDGGGGCFTARRPNGEVAAGGPSIDQVALRELYPDGSPTPIQTLPMGSFFRRNRDGGLSATRFVKCWREDGSPVELPVERPRELFTRIFGSDPTLETGDTEEQRKQKRYRTSVLDSVVEQYRHIQSERSGLAGPSRQRIVDHLDRVRELERRVLQEDELRENGCSIPETPAAEYPLLNGQQIDDGTGGPTVQVDDWTRVWQLNCELYATALRCDLVRFGNVLFQSSGERVRLQGDFRRNGNLVRTFNDGIASHEYWHRYRAGQNNENSALMEDHTRFIFEQLAYFYRLIDDPAFPDENGNTILENTLIIMGTELGDGARHDLDNVFHMISGANGRFKTGEVFTMDASGTDLYNTLLRGFGIERFMGDQNHYNGILSSVLDNPDPLP